MEEAFSPGSKIWSVVLMSTSDECLMEYSIISGGIRVSPWVSSAKGSLQFKKIKNEHLTIYIYQIAL